MVSLRLAACARARVTMLLSTTRRTGTSRITGRKSAVGACTQREGSQPASGWRGKEVKRSDDMESRARTSWPPFRSRENWKHADSRFLSPYRGGKRCFTFRYATRKGNGTNSLPGRQKCRAISRYLSGQKNAPRKIRRRVTEAGSSAMRDRTGGRMPRFGERPRRSSISHSSQYCCRRLILRRPG